MRDRSVSLGIVIGALFVIAIFLFLATATEEASGIIATKTIGDPKYDDGDIVWVTDQTEFNLTTGNPDHYIQYRVWYNGTWSEWINYTENFTLDGECLHELEWRASEFYGQWHEIQNQTHFVDSTPPITEKYVGLPYYLDSETNVTWVTNETKFELDPHDDGCEGGVGMNETWYRIWYNGNWTGWTFYNYTNPNENFTLDGECIHYIEYYSTDLLGNMETINNQTDYVDLTPPESFKVIIGPQLNQTMANETTNWVSSKTVLNITAEDHGCEGGSGIDHVSYRIWWRGKWSDWYKETGYGGTTPTGPGNGFSFDVTLIGECKHVIEWYTEDRVGHVSPTYNQTHYVDNKGPIVNKTIGEPKYWMGLEAKYEDSFVNGTYVIPFDEKQGDILHAFGFVQKVLETGHAYRVIERPNATLYTNLTPQGAVYTGGPILVPWYYGSEVGAAIQMFPNVTVLSLTQTFSWQNMLRLGKATEILIINGTWGHTYECLDSLGIPYDIVERSEYEDNPMMAYGYDLIVIDCPGWGFETIPYDVATILEDFAYRGGELMFNDISLLDMEVLFPEYVEVEGNVDTVHNFTFHYTDEFPGQYHGRTVLDIYTMGGGNIISQALHNDVKIMLDTDDYPYFTGSGYAIGAAYWQYGEGIVEGFAYHPQEQTPAYGCSNDSYNLSCIFYGNKFIHAAIEKGHWEVNLSTEINLTAYDIGCEGGVGVDQFEYRVYWNGSWSNWTLYDGNFTFTEECYHILEVNVSDKLGNWRIHNQTMTVDETPPVTQKIIGTPQYGEGMWVTEETMFTLTATDEGCDEGGVGVNATYYRIWYNGSWSNWTVYSQPFYLVGECIHHIEFYSVDNLGNVEMITNQTHYVDITAPVVNKSFDGPTYGQDDLWVTQNTDIYLIGTDKGCMGGVGMDKVWYRIWWNGSWSSWTEYEGMFNFTEDCFHYLEWYGVDLLGNQGEVLNQTHYVDTEGPTVDKWFDGPTSGSGDLWLTQGTHVFLNATDIGCMDGVGVDVIYYRTWWNGSWSSWIEYDRWFSFSEDCLHYLEWYSIDLLGNIGRTMNQTHYVDTVAPETHKTITGDQYGEDSLWIDDENYFYLNATDYGCEGGVGVNMTYYRVWYNGSWSAWLEYEQGFFLYGECVHYLEWYSVDWLGNTEQVQNQTHYLDLTAPSTTKGIGSPKYDDGNVTWVTNNTQFWLNATDDGCMDGVGVNHTWYRIWWNGSWTSWIEYEGSFTFDEDCTHILEWYSEDMLGNAEQVHNQTHYVDSTKPTILNRGFVGYGYYKGESFWCEDGYRRTLESTDRGCNNGVGINITAWRMWYNGSWSNWTYYNGFAYFNVNLTGECTHVLEVKAMDHLELWSDVYNETFFVDVTPPVTTKTIIGTQYDDGNVIWVTESTEFNLSATDYGCGGGAGVGKTWYNGSELREICYRIWYDGNWTSWMVYNGTFTLKGECEHIIEWYAVDWVNNTEETHNQTHYVDLTAPSSLKTITGPGVEGYTWVSNQTEFNLTSTDNGCMGGVGVDVIKYRIWYDGRWSSWTDYDGNFTMDGDCIHHLQWYAVDLLGNQEQINNQTHYVDITGPEINKTFEGPTYGQDDLWITKYTVIYLSGSDLGCMGGAGLEEIYYRFWWNGSWTQWRLFEESINFTEDCVHYLEWYGVDALGNEGEIKNQTHYVDTEAPVVIKEFSGPTYGQDDLWVSYWTDIYLNGTDKGCMGGVGMNKVWYRIWWNGSWSSWTEYDGYFFFDEDCVHYLEWYGVDLLGNQGEVLNQTHYVDTEGPSVDKWFGGPTYGQDDLWLTQGTDIYLNATDIGCMDGVGVDEIWYRIWWNGSWSNWTLFEEYFWFDEDCMHYLEWYAIDLLGNTGETMNQTHYVDTVAPTTSKSFSGASYGQDFLWISEDHYFFLNASDDGCDGGVGVNVTWYRVWYNGTWSQWMEHQDGFWLISECVHYLEWYSVDWLGNEEQVNNQTHYLDATAPNTTKGIGAPQYDDGEVIWVTNETQFWLNATDEGCMGGVGINHTWYRIWWNGSWTNWTEYNGSFTFDEDCVHYLEWYSEDILGNMEEVHNQTHNVDSWNASITFSMSPGYVESMDPLSFWISNQSNLSVYGYDDGCLRGVGLDHWGWRIWYDGSWTQWSNSTETFWILDECTHYLHTYAVDLLGNNGTSNITLYVDNTPPTSRRYTGGWPTVDDGEGNFFASESSLWSIGANDYGCNGGIGVNITYYRIWYNGTWTDWSEATHAYRFDGECTHSLEYYLVDDLGNTEAVQNDTYFIDMTAPVSTKTITGPQYDDQETIWVTDQTSFNFSAVDFGCNGGAGVLNITYRIWYNGSWSSWMEYDGNFTLEGECLHHIEWYAMDRVWNAEQVHNQSHYVDITGPKINKSFEGSTYGVDDLWVTQYTYIYLSGSDLGCIGGVGLDVIYYRIWWNGSWSVWKQFDESIYFMEDCVHYLEWYGVDLLGNEGEVKNQTHYVDTEAPVVIKYFSGPTYGQDDLWVSYWTDIYFNATDRGCMGGVGVNKTWYRIWWNGSWSGWREYDGGFWFPDDCLHYLEWFAVDLLGNTGQTINQTHYVDTEAPTSFKEIRGPEVEEYTWISNITWFNLTAYDNGCMGGVGVNYIEYRIWYDGTWSNWTKFKENFSMEGDCIHIIEWRAVDLLGNSEDVHNQTHYVDVTAPETIKSVSGLSYGRNYLWITEENVFYLNATDYGCMDGAGVNHTYYRIWYNGSWTQWMEYTQPFMLIGECVHYLEWYSVDYLGNYEEVRNQTHYVDLSGPTVDKWFDGPTYGQDDLWLSFWTDIHLNATDKGCMDGVGVDTIYYRFWWNGSWTQWTEYDEMFYFEEDCVHYLEWYAVDLLGNIGETRNQTHYVDTDGPSTSVSIEGPWYNYSYDAGNRTYYVWISDMTNITPSLSIDNGCMGGVGVDYLEYRTWYNGSWTNWTSVGLYVTLSFDEECLHLIEWRGIDLLGNLGPLSTFYLYVDITPPVTTKTITGTQYDDGEVIWVTEDTEFNLTAVDHGCEGGVGPLWTWYRIWYNGSWSNWTEYTGNFTLEGECMHIIEWYSTDLVNNTETIHNQTHYVDLTGPTVDKWFDGPTYGVEDLWVSFSTIIHLNATDHGCMGGVGVDKMYYRVWWNGSWTSWQEIEDWFHFAEDCIHYLEWYAVDLLGNIGETRNQTHYVDTEGPIVGKFFDGQTYGQDDLWMTNWTDIYLTALDQGCMGGVGVDEIWYRVWWNGSWTNWTKYDDVIIFEDCVHYLEWYAVDLLGNNGSTRNQTHYVDTVGPTVGKYFEGPTYDEDLWLTNNTFIGLTGTDQGCMGGVGLSSIWYRIWWNGSWSQWTQYTGSLYFDEDCFHILEWYGVDHLGNMGPIRNQTHYVDSIGPYVDKWFSGPTFGRENLWVSYWTNIYLNATDQGCNDGVGVDEIWYRIWWNGSWSKWIEYEDLFHFEEDCVHYLEWYAVDLLGNEGEIRNQTHFVDTEAPTSTKDISGPQWGNNSLWVTDETLFYLSAYDNGCNDGVGVKHIEYRIWYNGTWSNWTVYNGNFTLEGECIHYLQWRAIDLLDNYEITHNQTHNVDITAPWTRKNVGTPSFGEDDLWVTSSTLFGFTAFEQGCEGGAGLAGTNYRIWWQGSWTQWTTYDELFTLEREGNFSSQECVHYLEWYAWDILGNVEEVNNQTHYVDDTAPITNKTITGPQYDDGEVIWVTNETTFELTAEDDGCMGGAGVKEIWFRIWWNGSWTNWTQFVEPFTLDGECVHYIEWYAVDHLGNTEIIHNQTHFVDITPPETAKSIEGAYGQDDLWVTNNTYFFWSGFDKECNGGVGLANIYVRVWYNGSWSNWLDVYNWNGSFRLEGECVHYLEWYGVDRLGNEEDVHNQTHYLDMTPPETKKIITGFQWGPDSIIVNNETVFTLVPTDHGCMGGVGVRDTWYRIWYLGNWSQWIQYEGNFTMEGNCTHYLEWYSVDHLGNMEMVNNQTHKVNHIVRPTTNKTIVGPQFGNNSLWVTEETVFNLTATPGTFNYSATYYRIWYNGSWSNWTLYTGNFTLEGECVHYLEWYSVDEKGYEETVRNQTHYVDLSGPDVGKYFQGPVFGRNSLWVSYWTDIYLFAIDNGCMEGVGVDKVLYRIWWNGSWSNWTELQEFFWFEEDCVHYLEWYAIDLLGNVGETQNQTHYVDTVAPTSWKTITGPQYGNNSLWVTEDTVFNLSAYDEGCMDGAGIDYIEYRIWYKGKWSKWTIYKDNFTLEGECMHIIEWRAVDYLENSELVHNQTHYVDISGPSVSKLFFGPVYGEDDLWLANWTGIYLTAEDTGCNGGVGLDRINYRTWWNGSWSNWAVYDGPFSFPEECVHYIQWYAVDLLGNYGQIRNQTHYVDTSAPTSFKYINGPQYGTDSLWVTDETQFTFYGNDAGCMDGVGLDKIYYRIWYNGSWTFWTELEESFTLNGECVHYIEWYAVDHLGNKETVHNQTHYVDLTGPSVGKYFDGPTYGQDHLWISSGTDIYLTATDDGCNGGVGVDEIWYRYLWKGRWTQWMLYSGGFYFYEECVHILEWFAVDHLGNAGDTVNQTHYVDNEAPTTDKVITGPQYGNNSLWVTNETKFYLNASDGGCQDGVGLDYIEFRIWYNGTWTDWITYNGLFTLDDECTHYLEWRSVDLLGNWEQVNNQTHYVDNSAPITVEFIFMNYGQDPIWIDNETEIYLTAVDVGCQQNGVGIDYTMYRIWYDGSWSNWTTYESYFSLEDECVHHIEWYSVDRLGNVESIGNETHYVDISGPIVMKDLNGPVFGHDMLWVTNETRVSLNALDQGCMGGVGLRSIYYRIWWNGSWTNWTEDIVGFYFEEDCVHIIEWYAVDMLYNEGPTRNQTHFVDSVAPTSSKEIAGPGYNNYEWVTNETEFNLTAYDSGCMGGVGVEYTEYRIWHNGSWSEWTVYTEDFNLEGDCKHHLEWRAVDYLGNAEEVHNQTHFVDSSAPITNKSVGRPNFGQDALYVTEQTQFTLTAMDQGCDGGVGIAYTAYRIWYNGSWDTWTLYTGPFSLNGECTHYLEWFSEDLLGNVEQFHNQTHEVDLTAPVTTDDHTGGWRNTDVFVYLNAYDAKSGAITYWRVDGGNWTAGNLVVVYAPTDHSNDGNHTVEYYSVDNVGNTESTHSFLVQIDTRPPELITYFDEGLKKIKFDVEDDRDPAPTLTLMVKFGTTRIYKLEDDAGNVVIVKLRYKTQKISGWKIRKVNFKWISYNSGPQQSLAGTVYEIKYKAKSGTIKKLKQNAKTRTWVIDGQYSTDTGMTRMLVFDSGVSFYFYGGLETATMRTNEGMMEYILP